MKITEEAVELKDDPDSTIGGTVAEVLVSGEKKIILLRKKKNMDINEKIELFLFVFPYFPYYQR